MVNLDNGYPKDCLDSAPSSVRFAGIESTDGPLDVDERLVFMHFPKTAGTTVHNCLKGLFLPLQVCPERLGGISLWPRNDMERFRYFSCHAKIEEFRFIPTPLKMVTFLRNPIERAISCFEYWSSYTDAFIESSNLHIPRLVKSFGISEFFSYKNINQCRFIWNNYVAWLAGDPFRSPDGKPWNSTDQILNAAIQNLDRMAFVGISEDLNASFQRMSKKFDIPNTYRGQIDNKTKDNYLFDSDKFEPVSNIEITSEILDNITQSQSLDIKLYNYALEKFGGSKKIQKLITCVLPQQTECYERVGSSRTWVRRSNGGCLLHGPYIRLRPGKYTIMFEMQSYKDSESSEEKIGYIDVISSNRKESYAKTDLEQSILSDVYHIKHLLLSFELDNSASDVEFRVFLYSKSCIEVSKQVYLTEHV